MKLIVMFMLSFSVCVANENVEKNNNYLQPVNESLLLAQQQWTQGTVRASCDWKPKKVVKLDAFNCGRTDTGQPIRAEYECGKASDCTSKCIFIKCFSGP